MKKLSELPIKQIFLNNNTDHSSIKEYISKDKLICLRDDNTVIDDYWEFIEANKIIDACEDSYRFYLDSIYNHQYPFYESTFYYVDYTQKELNVNETLNRSWSSSELVSKLSEKYNIKKIDYESSHEICQFTSYFIDNINEIIQNKQFWSVLHLSNYYIKSIIDEQNAIIFEPYKPKDITNYIYDDCKGIIYHVTTKTAYEKIKKSEFAPKWKGKWDKLKNKPYDTWRDGRLFFVTNPNETIALKQLRSIKNTSQKLKDDYIYLKIDLYKYRHKLIFRIDSSAYGYNAYFTEEPIPGYCSEEIKI